MKLHAMHPLCGYRSDNRAPIIDDCRDMNRIGWNEMITVDEITIPVLTEAGEQRTFVFQIERVPANLRQTQILMNARDLHDTARDQTQSRMLAEFLAFARKHLHADANSKQ